MKVLLPVDGSPCSDRTLDWVSDILDKASVELYLLYVMDALTDIPIEDADIEAVEGLLQEAKTRLEKKGMRVAGCHYLVDRPSRGICLYADQYGMAQIIMGTHGHSGWKELLLGSVSKEVFRQARQPVVLFQNAASPGIRVSRVNEVSWLKGAQTDTTP
jgi:nucleotide-binding universal stress UspA family protein